MEKPTLLIDAVENQDAIVRRTTFDFLPDTLKAQCRRLVETYHEMHGFTSLADNLWKAELSKLIDANALLHELFRKATTAKRAKKANGYFIEIATIALSLEILARDFANWSPVVPDSKVMAEVILRAATPYGRTWLMDFYVYPPKAINPAVIKAVSPPHRADDRRRVDASVEALAAAVEPAAIASEILEELAVTIDWRINGAADEKASPLVIAKDFRSFLRSS